MIIIWHEIRKILNLRIFVVLAIFCIIFFLALGVSNTLDLIRYPHPVGAKIYRAHYYLEAAPYDLQEILSQEFLEWQQQFYIDGMASDCLYTFAEEMWSKLLNEANIFIAQYPLFVEYGIYYITSITYMWEKANIAGANTTIQRAMFRALFGEQSGFIGRKLEWAQTLELNLRDFGEARTRGFLANNLERAKQRELDERQRERLTEILEKGEYTSILRGSLFWGITDLFRHTTVILLMTSLILNLPLITTDRMRGIHYLQYHTRLGRRIVVKQFIAMLLSAIFVTSIILIGIGIYLGFIGAFAYLNEGITSHLTHFGPWSIVAGFTPITFLNYIFVLIGLCYGFSIGATSIAFILSRFSHNLISLAIKSLPTFIAMAWLHSLILPNRWNWLMVDRFTAPMTLWNHLYIRTGFAYLDIIIIAIFALVALIAAIIVARRERQLELL